MKWLAIPIEELKQFDKDWETRRMSNNGMKALLHEETYNMLVPPIMMLSEGEEVVEEVVYPYPLVDENEINSSDDWTSDEVIRVFYPVPGFSFSLFYCTLKNNSIFRVRVNCLIITYHFLLFLKNIMSLKERLC